METVVEWWAGLSTFAKVVVLWLMVAAVSAGVLVQMARKAPELPWHD